MGRLKALMSKICVGLILVFLSLNVQADQNNVAITIHQDNYNISFPCEPSPISDSRGSVNFVGFQCYTETAIYTIIESTYLRAFTTKEEDQFFNLAFEGDQKLLDNVEIISSEIINVGEQRRLRGTVTFIKTQDGEKFTLFKTVETFLKGNKSYKLSVQGRIKDKELLKINIDDFFNSFYLANNFDEHKGKI